jgi:hypothetical protein
MTLVLNVLTNDYVVQVSDRRLTDLNTGKPLDEPANKTILFCGHVVFGYTGLAKVGPLQTDFWLAERLLSAGPSAQATLEFVRDEASRAFQAVPSNHRRHAFVGVGWSQSRPILCVISNFMDARGHQLPHAHDLFHIDTVTLNPNDAFQIAMAGQAVPQEILVKLRRGAKRIVKHAGAGAMADLMVSQVWQVANRNEKVGKDLMVAVILRSAVPVASISMPSAPSRDEAAFYYVPSPDDATPRFYTPLWACAGMVAGAGEVWYGRKPPWWRD